MVVMVGFRRAKWFYRFSREILGWIPGVNTWLRNHQGIFGPDVWYLTALFFSQPCGGKNCKWCPKRDETLPVHTKNTPHMIKMTSTDELNKGVHATVDCPLDKAEAWVFIKLNSNENRAHTFFMDEGHKGYNGRGAVFSQLGICSRGVQSDLNTSVVSSFFCTELVSTFVQGCDGHQYKLAPCETTANDLFQRMNQTHPPLYVYTGDEDATFKLDHLRQLVHRESESEIV